MVDVVMTTEERDNINAIMEVTKQLPKEAQERYYYIGVGMVYGNQKETLEEKTNGEG